MQRVHGYLTGTNASITRLAKRNFPQFAHASIAVVLMAMINGRKNLPTNMASGRHFVRSGVPERSDPPRSDKYYPRPHFNSFVAIWGTERFTR